MYICDGGRPFKDKRHSFPAGPLPPFFRIASFFRSFEAFIDLTASCISLRLPLFFARPAPAVSVTATKVTAAGVANRRIENQLQTIDRASRSRVQRVGIQIGIHAYLDTLKAAHQPSRLKIELDLEIRSKKGKKLQPK